MLSLRLDTGIYAPDASEPHTEASTNYAKDFLGNTWQQAEAAGKLPADGPTRQVTVRAGWVLGTGVRAYLFVARASFLFVLAPFRVRSVGDGGGDRRSRLKWRD